MLTDILAWNPPPRPAGPRLKSDEKITEKKSHLKKPNKTSYLADLRNEAPRHGKK